MNAGELDFNLQNSWQSQNSVNGFCVTSLLSRLWDNYNKLVNSLTKRTLFSFKIHEHEYYHCYEYD